MLSELVLVWGLPILLLLIFLGQLGLPLGSLLFLCWYGSTITEVERLFWVIPLLMLSAILGDYVAYLIAQKYRIRVKKFINVRPSAAKQFLRGELLIHRNASMIVFITRFLLFGLGPMVNYLMGLRSYSRVTFMWWVCFGEFIYISEFILLGYVFRDTWQELLIIITDIGWVFASMCIAALVLWTVRKRRLAHKKKHNSNKE
jgi:membrane-associated protein